MNHSRNETLLQVSGVNLTLGGNPILRDLNAEVRNIIRPGHSQGQVVALLGPSGVGKTQLFQILSGLKTPDAGEVRITSDLVPVEAGMVGVVSQQYHLFDHRTVFGNLMVAARQKGFSKEEAEAMAVTYLKRFGISQCRGSYPKELSGGQRQRVAIIQQLFSSTHFLLMDEPFSGLDPVMKDQARKLVVEVAAEDEHNTIVVTTHDVESAVAIADTIWLLGRQFDAAGNSLGANVRKVYDLVHMGLAWDEDIQDKPEFYTMTKEIKREFASL